MGEKGLRDIFVFKGNLQLVDYNFVFRSSLQISIGFLNLETHFSFSNFVRRMKSLLCYEGLREQTTLIDLNDRGSMQNNTLENLRCKL